MRSLANKRRIAETDTTEILPSDKIISIMLMSATMWNVIYVYDFLCPKKYAERKSLERVRNFIRRQKYRLVTGVSSSESDNEAGNG